MPIPGKLFTTPMSGYDDRKAKHDMDDFFAMIAELSQYL
jgi:hypothetical protein